MDSRRQSVLKSKTPLQSTLHREAPRNPATQWKFQAAQLTYNATVGDWASKDKAVIKALFNRMVVFFQALIARLQVHGVTVTIEESLQRGEHVHARVYIVFAGHSRNLKSSDASWAS